MKLATLRTLLAWANKNKLKIHQMDAKSAYLNGILDRRILMRPPPGYRIPGIIWQIKGIYGLKQAGRQWYIVLRDAFLALGYVVCESDHAVFIRIRGDDISVVGVQVDNMIVIGDGDDMIDRMKRELLTYFDMTDQGPIHWIVGLEVKIDESAGTLSLGQTSYIQSII